MLTDCDFTLVYVTGRLGSQLQPVIALLQCLICSCILSVHLFVSLLLQKALGLGLHLDPT